MSSKIENEKKWLQTVVIPKMFENGSLIENSKENFNLSDLRIQQIEIKFIGPEEAFMLTNCYRATIEYEIGGQADKRHLVIKKTPPLPEDIFNGIQFGALFNNEIIAYNKLIPAIEQLTKNVFEVPKYFYSEQEHCYAAIALEDFGLKGWQVPKDKYNLSLEHLLIAVKYLGQFHAIGMAMRELKRDEFDNIASQLKEARYECNINDDWALSLKQSIQRLLKATRQYHPEVSEEFLAKLQKLLGNGFDYGKKRIVPIEPFITICHGDFLRNNIAFRYDIKDGKEIPTDIMMFDLQTLRVSSPMLDLAFLLMMSAFAEVRYKNFEQIFEAYRERLVTTYETLTKKIAPSFMSSDSLLKEFVRYIPFGSHTASYFLRALVDPPTVSPDEFLVNDMTKEEIIADLMTGGGELVDRELSHQVKELYELSLRHGVDISEGIRVT